MFASTHHLAEQFPHALQRMEQSRDVDEPVGFFAETAVLSNLGDGHERRGPEGARQFWQAYLDRFAGIRSEFTHLHMSERADGREIVALAHKVSASANKEMQP